MKIALAQIRSIAGDIPANTLKHTVAIKLAAEHRADMIVFPELSLSNYEPTLAAQSAILPTDNQFDLFQQLSDSLNINIMLGMPLKNNDGILIGCLFFQPLLPVKIYHKQILHPDEEPFFIPGKKKLLFEVANQKIAPAICFESLQSSHAQDAVDLGADIYLASVFKPYRILSKAYEHYSMMAKRHAIPVLMVNGVGAADDFIAAGSSAYWKQDGSLVASLDQTSEALLIVDMEQKKGASFAITSS